MIASAPSPGAAGSVPFAGRENELAILHGAAVAAGRGEPRVLIIEGHAGMGKSALLGEFARRLPDEALLVRVSGAEPESRLPYWLAGQLISGVEAPGSVTARRAADIAKNDPLAAGAGLAGALSQAMTGGRLVVLVIDDLHWADPESATAILHALRRTQAGTLLVAAAARPRELGQLGGGGWTRFAAGDHRATRLCLGGLSTSDMQALARAAGLAELTEHSAARLVRSTAGRPGYCRVILGEFGRRPGGASLFRPLTGDLALVPQAVVDHIEGRATDLSPEARSLIDAAAVLGLSSSLTDAAGIAGLTDPLKALEEITETGLLAEGSPGPGGQPEPGHLGGQIQFADPVSQLAFYRQVSPTRRRELHRRAAETGSPSQRLRHQFASVAGPDPRLAAELERAGRRLAGDDSEAGQRRRHRFAAAGLGPGSEAGLERTNRWPPEDDLASENGVASHEPRAAAGEPGEFGEPGGSGFDGLAVAGEPAELGESGGSGADGLAAAGQLLAGSGSGSVTATRAAAVWLAQAAALAADRGDRDRLLLDAVELLLGYGEAAAAGELAVMITQAAPARRRDTLLGWLDLLTGRFAQAEERLAAARQADPAGLDQVSYAHATTGLLWCRLHAGRFDDAVVLGQQAREAASGAHEMSPGRPAVAQGAPAVEPHRSADQEPESGDPQSHTDVHRVCETLGDDTGRQWSGRAVTWADGDADWAIALACAGRGAEAMASFGSLPAGAGEVPMGATGILAARGIVRVMDGAFEAAVTDLSVVASRLEGGCAVRLGGLAMGFLAEAEYQLGGWSAAAQHADLALRMTCESGRSGELSLVHAFAALVPVGRGDWEAATGHVETAGKAARGSGTALGMTAWASARAGLALARGDGQLALRAAQTVKDTGREEALSRLGFFPWPLLEAEALIALGRPAEARARLKDSGYPEPQAPNPTSSTRDPGLASSTRDPGLASVARDPGSAGLTRHLGLTGVARGPDLAGLDQGPGLTGVVRGPDLAGLDQGPGLTGVVRGPGLAGLDQGPELASSARDRDLVGLTKEPDLASLARDEPGAGPTADGSGSGGPAGTGPDQPDARPGEIRGGPGELSTSSRLKGARSADADAGWEENSAEPAGPDQEPDENTPRPCEGAGKQRLHGVGVRLDGPRAAPGVFREGLNGISHGRDEISAEPVALDQDPRAVTSGRGAISSVREENSHELGVAGRVTEELAARRLHGLLAADSGDAARAAAIFAAGRSDPRAGAVPYQLAQLELAAGRGLRLLAQRPEAIAWLREARGRLVRLGAAPAVVACDQELAACGVQMGREVSAATLGLTPTELAVASLVAAGRSNRQAAAELYISIKGIEFHLRNIFAKLGIRSRKDLADRLGDDADVMTLA